MNRASTMAVGFVGVLGVVLSAFGAPRQFQGGTSTVDPPCMPIFAKATSVGENNGVIHLSWTTAGRHGLPKGERGPDGKSVRYTYLGCFAAIHPADVSVIQADGKKVTAAEARQRLQIGTVVLVSMDTGEVSREYLDRIKGDTLVIRIEKISLTESAGAE